MLARGVPHPRAVRHARAPVAVGGALAPLLLAREGVDVVGEGGAAAGNGAVRPAPVGPKAVLAEAHHPPALARASLVGTLGPLGGGNARVVKACLAAVVAVTSLHPPPRKELVAPPLARDVVAVEVDRVPRVDHVVAGRLGVVAVNVDKDALGPPVAVLSPLARAPGRAVVALHPHRPPGAWGAHGANITPRALGPDETGGARDPHVAVLALGTALPRLAAIALLPGVPHAPRGPNRSRGAALPLRTRRPSVSLGALLALRARGARPPFVLHRHSVDDDRKLLDELPFGLLERGADL
mmetsp:Transcript_25691/g.65351  ORF Transcript_25691/g.65351 Transcript_25691/m.65351 type:complete len:297 (-) Transcript_25691:460-1350(-)